MINFLELTLIRPGCHSLKLFEGSDECASVQKSYLLGYIVDPGRRHCQGLFSFFNTQLHNRIRDAVAAALFVIQMNASLPRVADDASPGEKLWYYRELREMTREELGEAQNFNL